MTLFWGNLLVFRRYPVLLYISSQLPIVVEIKKSGRLKPASSSAEQNKNSFQLTTRTVFYSTFCISCGFEKVNAKQWCLSFISIFTLRDLRCISFTFKPMSISTLYIFYLFFYLYTTLKYLYFANLSARLRVVKYKYENFELKYCTVEDVVWLSASVISVKAWPRP